MTHHSDGKQEALPWGWGWGRKSEGCHTSGQYPSYQSSVVILNYLATPKHSMSNHPIRREDGAVSLPWCHIWGIMWQRAINITKGPLYWPLVRVMSGGFKAPNLQPQSTETHPLSAYSGISLGSDSYSGAELSAGRQEWVYFASIYADIHVQTWAVLGTWRKLLWKVLLPRLFALYQFAFFK